MELISKTEYIGNCDIIFNCDNVTNQLIGNPGHIKTPINPYSSNVNFSDKHIEENKKMYDNWNKWGYIENNSIEWINYYSEKDFNDAFLDLLASELSIEIKHVWISSVRPGKCIPWHRDIENLEKEWSREGNLVRYTIFLNDPEIGQFFVVDDQCFHMIKKGSMYKWNEWNYYHLGANIGKSKKYLLHVIGIDV